MRENDVHDTRTAVLLCAVLTFLASCGDGGNGRSGPPARPSSGGTPPETADDVRGAGRGAPVPFDSALSAVVRRGSLSVRDGTLDLHPAVARFYADRDTSGAPAPPIWTAGGGLDDRVGRVLSAVEGSRREGLDPEAFHATSLASLVGDARGDAAGPTVLARTEVLLSDALVRLASALANGRADRQELEVSWELERSDTLDARALLGRLADGAPPAVVLDSLRPRLPVYERMATALDRYRGIEENGGWPSVPVDSSAERGDTGRVVARVRARLRRSGSDEERRLAEAGTSAPDAFDGGLQRAVEHFQRRHGLAVDGIAGEETMHALNIGVEERIEALILNLDRLRWLPRRLGPRAILVNVAGFELLVLEDEEPTMRMAVVVGRPEWRTAVFTEPMEYLVFNPYWHVPETIERSDVLPAVRRDLDHLADQNLSVVPADDNFGEPVDPSTVDWDVAAGSFPYDFRQEPGPENALGRIKFMFPNDHDIYLHDTPADHLFEKNFRAFSHGCIRVERPRDLARYVLEHATERAPGQVERLLESRERTRVDLTETIPVYIAYLTAWVDEDGRTSFHQDLYGRDEALARELAPIS